jgi:hypothetical protein
MNCSRCDNTTPQPIKGYQDNRGKRWSPDEDMYLLQQIPFMSPSDIGKHLKRSENAVMSRLKKLAFHMVQNGDDPEVVKNNLKLTDQDMDQINNECFIYTRKTSPKPGKFINTIKKTNKKGYFATTEQTQELQLLLEIRSMLRRLLHQSDVKSPRVDLVKVSEIDLEDLERKSEEFAKLY